MNPPPHEVLDRLLLPVHLDRDFDDGYSFKKHKKPLQLSLEPTDWLNTPLYLTEIKGMTELNAVIQVLPKD